MSRARTARRIATAAAYGGGGLSALGGAVTALLVAEAKLARRWVGEPVGSPPVTDGLYGHGDGAPLSLAMLGDSSAAGLGVDDPHRTPGVRLAAGLGEATGRPVRLTSVAVVGARSDDLDAQVTRALVARPDVAVVMIGANDVTHRVRPSTSVRYLDHAVRRLRAAGAQVVVGTCPDLGTVEPIAQPLRLVARRWSRQLAAAQTIAVVEAGGRSVSLGDVLGPEFAAEPRLMFGPDRFHPSADGYASCAAVLLPSACAALGIPRDEEAEPEPFRGEGVLPVAMAAVEAADEAGTEVAATQVAGRDRGPRGRWALLRHRRRRPLPEAETIEGPAS
ncbi:MAG: SGNH/GDSL hydrolase family protein [Actinomycetes bacterium]